MGNDYRKNRLNKHPYEKIINNIIGPMDCDHLHKQCDNGSHDSSNTRMKLVSIHRARHACENGKKCNLLNKLRAGILDIEDGYY